MIYQVLSLQLAATSRKTPISPPPYTNPSILHLHPAFHSAPCRVENQWVLVEGVGVKKKETSTGNQGWLICFFNLTEYNDSLPKYVIVVFSFFYYCFFENACWSLDIKLHEAWMTKWVFFRSWYGFNSKFWYFSLWSIQLLATNIASSGNVLCIYTFVMASWYAE